MNPVNNYTFHIPWSAYSRLHLTIEANDTVRLHANGDYVCDCTHRSFVIEPGDEASILLTSNSSVSGMKKQSLGATRLELAGSHVVSVVSLDMKNTDASDVSGLTEC